jgi:hypothetical protein
VLGAAVVAGSDGMVSVPSTEVPVSALAPPEWQLEQNDWL